MKLFKPGQLKRRVILMYINHKNGSYQIMNQGDYEIIGSSSAGSDGLTPIELLESSLGLCVSITLHQILERDGFGRPDLEVTVTGKKAEDSPSRVESFLVDVKLSEQLDEDYSQKLILSAERACTIGNTLKQGVKIQTKLSPGEEK
jgi:uncharacterized OsmC-like protein